MRILPPWSEISRGVRARAQNEQGVVLIIVAVMVLGVLTVMLVLGVDSVRVQRATMALRKEVDEICQNVSERAMIQGAAAGQFAAEMTDLLQYGKVPFATQMQARLLIPTTTASFLPPADFPQTQTCTCVDSNCMDEGNTPPFVAGPLSMSGCPTGISCLFEGDFCRAFTSSSLTSTRYPGTLIENIEGAGNSVGCEISAIVPSVVPLGLFTPKTIVARTMWRRVVRSNFTSPPAIVQDLPGLTIAVAPYLTTHTSTWSSSPFNFASTALTAPYSQGFRSQIDPTYGASPPPAFTSARPVGDGQFTKYPYQEGHEFPPYDALSGEKLQELRAACVNPAALVRNVFLATIAELASRTGELRNRTEIVFVNPRHATANSPSPPVNILPFGNDILRTSLGPPFGSQLPYLVYRGGSGGAYAQGSENISDPFVPGLQSVGLFVSQLRVCYSLFHGGDDGGDGDGLFRYGADGFSDDALSTLLTNTVNGLAVEDSDAGGIYGRVASLYQPLAAYSNGDPWDQRCPWGAVSGTCTSLAGQETRPLRVPELLSIFGSAQLCPLEDLDPSGACEDSDRPKWPDQTSGDLAPDIAALFQYIGGQINSFKAPGLFKFKDLELDDTTAPFDTSGSNPPEPYQGWISTRSHVLLVLHRPPSAGELTSIVNARGSANLDGGAPNTRSLTVVYLPTTFADAADGTGSALERIRTAFKIPSLDQAPTPDDNALFVFSPTDPKYQPSTGIPGFPQFQGSEEKQFAEYWQYMLGQRPADQDGDREHIVDAAATIFFTRLMKAQRKF